jgi:hypothetical protein
MERASGYGPTGSTHPAGSVLEEHANEELPAPAVSVHGGVKAAEIDQLSPQRERRTIDVDAGAERFKRLLEHGESLKEAALPRRVRAVDERYWREGDRVASRE